MSTINKNKDSNGTTLNKTGPKTESESKAFVDKDSDNIPDIGVDKHSYSFQGFDEEFFDRQLFKESSFRPSAVSEDNAKGIAQITPITIKELKRLKLVSDDFDPFNPEQSKDAQKKYMDHIHNRDWVQGVNFDGESPEIVKVVKTLMGYNMGPEKAVKALNKIKKSGVDIYESTEFVGKLNNETKDYVRSILNLDNDPGKQDYFETELLKGLSKYKKPVSFMDGEENSVEELFNN
jgi:hypothetical protein